MPDTRVHIVLIPGFGGFDALGKVEYYAGVTSLFEENTKDNRVRPVLHYFDNLPTAAVRTRAARLAAYLAKRFVRGEIGRDDTIVLAGHSTGGLDIRQLLWDLHTDPDRPVYVDGQLRSVGPDILRRIRRVVFLSVPHHGTNIADWVHAHGGWRASILAELRAGVAGSQLRAVDRIETALLGASACLTGAELLLAAKDALTEANPDYGDPSPTRLADAQEAAADLALYLRHMSTDFHAIHDLSVRAHRPEDRSPAHFTPAERRRERDYWRASGIGTLSVVTLGGRPFRFSLGEPAPEWRLAQAWTYPELTLRTPLAEETDPSYRICYRACAGGPFKRPLRSTKGLEVIGPKPPEMIEVWDNDGIVNTLSMFFPEGETVLVMADHLDVVGHYALSKMPEAGRPRGGREPARIYRSYDGLRSAPRFTAEQFERVWKTVFQFAAPRTLRAAA